MAASETPTGVMGFLLSSIPRPMLLQMYGDDERGLFVCIAVMRVMPVVTRQFAIRVLACGGAFDKNMMKMWTKDGDLSYLDPLYKWSVILPDDGKGDVVMTPEFLKSYSLTLVNIGAIPWEALTEEQLETAALTNNETYKPVTPEDLERYTLSEWDTIMHFLVGTPNYQDPPGPVIDFVLQTGLVQIDPEFDGPEEDAPYVIASKGYEFMLLDTHQQVWHFVSQYLEMLKGRDRGVELLREALFFLICLSSSRVGEAYPASSLSKDCRVMLQPFSMFGLLKIREFGKSSKSSVFYPTQVALSLVKETSHSASMWALSDKAMAQALANPQPGDSSHLAIIVQSNFTVFAYTTSRLHINMLGLFCEVSTIRRLPNMVNMKMTRDSVKSALALGIDAKQILRFLERHAHPQVRKNKGGPVPANIRDQIVLWNRERNRLHWTEVYLYECTVEGEFDAVKQWAVENKCFAYGSEDSGVICVNTNQEEQVQEFSESWKSGQIAGMAVA